MSPTLEIRQDLIIKFHKYCTHPEGQGSALRPSARCGGLIYRVQALNACRAREKPVRAQLRSNT